jgi:hypothetical protein
MGRVLGPLLVVVGLGLVVVGLLAWSGALGWFGRLPGDLHVEDQRSRLVIPITSMVLVSVVLTVVVNLVLRWLR